MAQLAHNKSIYLYNQLAHNKLLSTLPQDNTHYKQCHSLNKLQKHVHYLVDILCIAVFTNKLTCFIVCLAVLRFYCSGW